MPTATNILRRTRRRCSDLKPRIRGPRLAIAFAAFALTTSVAATTPPYLDCRLRMPETVIPGRPVRLAFELLNKGAVPVRVLAWNTPLEGWFGSFLKLERDGVEIPYQGPMVKRGAPAADDYVRIAPAAKAAATLDLAQVYSTAAPGLYTVTFTGSLHDVAEGRRKVPGVERRPISIPCAPVRFRVGTR